LTAEDARFDLDGITSLAVNPASTLVIVGGADGGVRVVSLSKGEVVGTLNGHTKGESVEAVKFVEIGGQTDAPAVVTGGTDGKLCIWDINTMRLRTTHTHTVKYSPRITTVSPLTMSFHRMQ
jgi:ribosome assembly protein SQT1